MSSIIETGSKTFAKDVLTSDMPVLVDFWAEWCGPCRMLLPVVEQLAAEKEGIIKVVKVNADENSGLTAEMHVSSLPTLILFIDGKPVHYIKGAKPLPALIAELSDHVEGLK